MKKKNIGSIIFYLLIIGGAFLFLTTATGGNMFGGGKSEQVNYTQLVQELEHNKIEEIYVNNGINGTSFVEAKLKGGEEESYLTAYVPSDKFDLVLDEYVKTATGGSLKVEYGILTEDAWGSILITLALSGGLIFFMFFIFNQQGSGGGKVMNFGKSKARLYQKSDNKVTFNDVAGADEEKQELTEVVDFLKHPDKYMKLGAKIPKGVLLVGSPGTGKTLLAKATAGEAGVPFFTISGSDFVEMFVGVGASRVRDLFDGAKKNAPCIVFIDEIDAVGRQRGAGLGGGNDEREQTLNQLLVEMDGFAEHQGIIVLAATNRADILDPALLRPGRFDRQVTVYPPDVKGREEILGVHSKNKPLADDVKLNIIAKATAGFTGADLANVMNEASLLAARGDGKKIGMGDLEEAIKRVIAGPEKKSRVVTDADKKITAYHEAGHAIVSFVTPNCDPVHEISIIPRGMAAGYNLSLPDNDNNHMSKNMLLDDITCLLGGRAAEEILLEDICTGASNDIERATKIARKMVTGFGMSEELGPINYDSDNDDVFIGRDMLRSKGVSELTASKIDAEVKRIISESYDRAKHIIETNRDRIELVVSYLLEKEVITGDEFRQLCKNGVIDNEKTDFFEAFEKNEKVEDTIKIESNNSEESEAPEEK